MSDSTKTSSSSASTGKIHIDPTGFVKLGAQLPTLANILAQSIDELGLALSATQQRTLLLYLDQLLLWNKAYNLTAITDPIEALIKHIIDCCLLYTSPSPRD